MRDASLAHTFRVQSLDQEQPFCDVTHPARVRTPREAHAGSHGVRTGNDAAICMESIGPVPTRRAWRHARAAAPPSTQGPSFCMRLGARHAFACVAAA